MDIRIERLKTMRAIHTHILTDTPEEDAGRRIRNLARSKGLLEKSENRLFGRNAYPTDNPDSHSYEFYMTLRILLRF